MKKLAVLVIMLIFSTSFIFSQLTQQQLETKLEQLEKSESLRKEQLDLQMKVLKVENDKILENKKRALDDKLDEIQQKITIYGPILSGFTLLGIIVFFWRSKKYINDQMNKRVGALIQEKEEDFRRLIRSQEIETRVKQNNLLLVLSCNEQTEEEITRLIASFGFPKKNVAYRTIKNVNDVNALSLEGKDIIIINDIESVFDRELLGELISKSEENILFLGYATGTEQLPRNSKMNFANSKFTLYRNLIDLLKFKEIYKK